MTKQIPVNLPVIYLNAKLGRLISIQILPIQIVNGDIKTLVTYFAELFCDTKMMMMSGVTSQT